MNLEEICLPIKKDLAEVETVIQRPMTEGEWNALADLRVDGFWHFGPAEFPQPVFDGSKWVLEGAAWGDNATLSNAGALGEAVDCDEFLVAVPVTPGELDEVCGSSNDCAPSDRANPRPRTRRKRCRSEERFDRPKCPLMRQRPA